MRRAAGFLALLLCLYWTGAQGESGGLTENDAEILGVKATSPDIWAELKELKYMLRKLEQENTALEARMNNKVEELERKRQNAEVAFFAGLTNYGRIGPVSADTRLKFSKVFTNVGQGYDPETGVFTAPVRGTYHISFRAFENSDGNSLRVNMYRNGKIVTVAHDRVLSGGYADSSSGVVLHLEKGDQIYLVLRINCSVYDDLENQSTFSGFLLFAE